MSQPISQNQVSAQQWQSAEPRRPLPHRPSTPASPAGSPTREPRRAPGDRLVAPLTLWARATWSPGSCFRCDREGLEVTPFGLLPTVGILVEICVCRACVFQVEQTHWATLLSSPDHTDDSTTEHFSWWRS